MLFGCKTCPSQRIADDQEIIRQWHWLGPATVIHSPSLGGEFDLGRPNRSAHRWVHAVLRISKPSLLIEKQCRESQFLRHSHADRGRNLLLRGYGIRRLGDRERVFQRSER